MLYLVGVSIAVFLAFVLAGKPKKSIADKLLLLWLLVIGGHLFIYYTIITDKIYEYPFLIGLHIPYPLLHGPLLYLYTLALTSKNKNRKWYWSLHGLLPFGFYAYLIPFFLLPIQEKIWVLKNNGIGYESFIHVCSIAITVFGTGYIIASLYALRKYRKSMVNDFSFTERINLSWLRYLIYGIAVIWIFVILGWDQVIFGSATLFVCLLGFFGIRQVGVFSKKNSWDAIEVTNNRASLLANKEELEENEKVKYAKSSLTQIEGEEINTSLNKLMQQEKLFTNPELRLSDVAEALKVHPNTLSQVINTYEGQNFYDYINHQRIEEFKKIVLLAENQKFTLISLAYDCGFNSKPSFNRNFKKVTGISPTTYLKQLQEKRI